MANSTVQVGLPPEVVDLIDNDRGDVSRSLYLRKLIIESVYKKFNLSKLNAEDAEVIPA